VSVPDAAWRDAADAIRSAREVALACHVGPDGDALGSMLALALALAKQSRPAVASWGGEPFVVPKHYAFLPGLDRLSKPEEVPAAPEVMVTFDCGTFDRLGSLEPNARAAATLVVVDHHVAKEPFGTVNLVDPAAAASAVLTRRLIAELGVPLDREIATCLYTGLLTDTGSFKYRNTTPEVHALAGELLSHGVAHDEIARLVYDTHPLGYLSLLGVALGRVELVPAASMIWTFVTTEDLERAGIGLEETEALIDVVRTAEEAEVACVLKQGPDATFKVSMRSKGLVNVGAVCESFGGGGHALAAGFTAEGSDPRAIAAAVASRLPGGAAAGP
jgi:phosphoesterase RecJ-like protein